MAPQQSSVKSTAKKAGNKFASKLVKDVMDQTFQAKLMSNVQNPKTLEKWIAKMKLSVLKKISIASKVAFIPQAHTAENLKKEIVLLKQRIATQTATVKESAIQTVKQSKLADIGQPNEHGMYQSGRFDAQADRIKSQFGEIANSLASNLSDMPGCVLSLSSSIAATESDWKQVSLQITANSTNTGMTRKTNKTKAISASKSPNKPVEVLYNHLGRS